MKIVNTIVYTKKQAVFTQALRYLAFIFSCESTNDKSRLLVYFLKNADTAHFKGYFILYKTRCFYIDNMEINKT